jgi:glucokinase
MNLVGDIGGTTCKIAIIHNSKILAMTVLEYPEQVTFERKMDFVLEKAKEISKASNQNYSEINRIGLSFPGIVDPISTRVLSINDKHEGILEFDFNAWAIEKGFLKIVLENDARAALMGEYSMNFKRQQIKNCVGITLGTGIGTAVIINENLLHGSNFQAAINMGHQIVEIHGNTCNCGGLGCAESYASTWSMRRDTVFSSFRVLFDEIERKHPNALAYFEQCLDVWAACILNLSYAYDPEVIVIGGGVMNQSNRILPLLENKVRKLSWKGFKHPELIASTLLEKSALFGMNALLDIK